METVILKARERTDAGKRSSRALRRKGDIPCIMYGGKDSEKLSVDAGLLAKALSGEHGRRVILQLDVEGKNEKHNTLLKELQYHPIYDKLIHADFMVIDLEKPMKAKLPVMPEGEAVGVKIKGGHFKVHKQQISVMGLPYKIPSEIIVNISALDIGDSLTLGEIPMPEGITKIDPDDMVVVSVGQPKAVPAEAEAEVPAVETAEGAEAPEAAESGEKKE
jgi:large subunit ribosomal protein L25